MSKHLIILSESASFPWGMAAANRVRNLAKSAMMEGWRVTYLGLRGADIKKNEIKIIMLAVGNPIFCIATLACLQSGLEIGGYGVSMIFLGACLQVLLY